MAEDPLEKAYKGMPAQDMAFAYAVMGQLAKDQDLGSGAQMVATAAQVDMIHGRNEAAIMGTQQHADDVPLLGQLRRMSDPILAPMVAERLLAGSDIPLWIDSNSRVAESGGAKREPKNAISRMMSKITGQT